MPRRTVSAVATLVFGLFATAHSQHAPPYRLVAPAPPQPYTSWTFQSVNSAGVVAGLFERANFSQVPGRLTLDGHFSPIVMPSSLNFYPEAINDQGDVAGHDDRHRLVIVTASGTPRFHPGIQALRVGAINNTQTVVGTGFSSGHRLELGYVWDRSTGLRLLIDTHRSSAAHIDESGTIVGSQTPNYDAAFATVWRGDWVTVIPSPLNYSGYAAMSNARGTVVGTFIHHYGYQPDMGFVWDARSGLRLLTPDFGWASVRVTGIDDRGRVYGWRRDWDGSLVPLVWPDVRKRAERLWELVDPATRRGRPVPGWNGWSKPSRAGHIAGTVLEEGTERPIVIVPNDENPR